MKGIKRRVKKVGVVDQRVQTKPPFIEAGFGAGHR
jgi:hypothetical protein